MAGQQTPNFNQPGGAPQSDNVSFSLHDIIQLVLANWYWFVLSVVICVACGYVYIARTPKVYSRTANILVKDSRKGGDTDLASFSDLAGISARRNVDNEIYILQSRRLMREVVRRLGLTVSYSVDEKFRARDLYGQSPIHIDFINDNDAQNLSFEVTLLPDSAIRLGAFDAALLSKEDTRRSIAARLGDTVSTPLGQLIVRPTLYLSPAYLSSTIRISKGNLDAVTDAYRGAVKSVVANKQASIITISMNNTVPRRAEDVINTLIAVYEEDAVADKRSIAQNTSEFIENRLQVIGRELGMVDKNIERFKQTNRMYDITTEAARTLAESTKYKNEGLSVENQIRMAEFLKEYLLDASKINELIPATVSIANSAIADQIASYNEAVLRRAKLMTDSSENNPVILDLDNGLVAVRRAIIASLDSHISTLGIQLDAMRREEAMANRRISSVPSQEKEILDITRQQKIKEELYLYLLNKREENALTMVITESNSRTIDNAFGSSNPLFPNKSMILAIAILFGLAIPFLIIYMLEILDTTIRGRKDLEDRLSIPFLGDIPEYTGAMQRGGVVVRENGRDAVSEAFRILRSNMSFMNVNSRPQQVIMVTSTNPHAGKTFVSTNLAMTLALTGKRVILIDLDLRRRTFTKQMGRAGNTVGITNYLSGNSTAEEIVHKSSLNNNLDIIYSGPQPPNPGEMLLSEQLDKLMEQLRARYDYVIIDSVPAMAVADAMITDRLSDLCIYVIREGLLDRRQLPDIERLYREKKLRNMCTVLNGTRISRHNYGYGYGYGYGYSGYGYGLYNEDEAAQRKKGWRNRIRGVWHKLTRKR